MASNARVPLSGSASSNSAQPKGNATPKSLDSARKQAASPADGSSASRKPAPKAWTSGTNPITQRSTTSPVANGNINGNVRNNHTQHQAAPTPNSGSSAAYKHAHDRLIFLLANFTGLEATLTLKNGERFSGVFAGASLESNDARYLLKMVRKLQGHHTQLNGSANELPELIGDGDDHAMAFDVRDTADLDVKGVDLGSSQSRTLNGTASNFRTDTEISGQLSFKERELQRWQPGPDTEVDLSLGGSDSTGLGAWDQFAANEKLYNVRSDYDEGIYTTSIDKKNPKYKEIEEKARRLAREMEKEGSSRGLDDDNDTGLDEEDKYSGVRRDASLSTRGPNAYVPPSRRSASNKPTVSEAPLDPAIISSQLARTVVESEAKAGEAVAVGNGEASELSGSGAPSDQAESGNASQTELTSAQPTDSKTSAAPSQPNTTIAPASQAEQAPDANNTSGSNYYQRVHESFKQFANSEKLRLQVQQRALAAQKSNTARVEKSVKLNDLKKFSQNFKLNSRVPEDLVPILAKTKEKQDEIRTKAEQQAAEKEQKAKDTASTSPSASKPDSQRSTPADPVKARVDTTSPSASRSKVGQSSRGQPALTQLPRGAGAFSQRVAQNQAQYRTALPANIPSPLPIIPMQSPSAAQTGTGDSGLTSPTSAMASRFNVKAMEFRPNPAASTFTPGGPSGPASPGPKRQSISVSSAPTPAASGTFFPPGKRPSKLAAASSERPLSEALNPVERMLNETDESKKSAFAANGGIAQAYRTPPVWDVPDANQEKGYNDMFQKALTTTNMSPIHGQSNPIMPHSHQLPLHLQNGHGQQNPRFYPGQHPNLAQQHGEDQRVHYSSTNSSVQPSPRMGMAYPGQMHPQMPGYPYGMPTGGMSPAMHMRPMPAGGQFMGPQGSPMGGHMMVQQPSNGPYMNGPSPGMSLYPSPGPSHAQPHFVGHQGQHPGPGGYMGSPRAHPMSHQGSQQGHAPQPMYMSPGQNGQMMMPQHGGPMTPMRGNYGQPSYAGQQMQHPYSMQQRTMSNSGYNNHMTPRQQHAMPHQGPNGGPMMPQQPHGGDDGR